MQSVLLFHRIVIKNNRFSKYVPVPEVCIKLLPKSKYRVWICLFKPKQREWIIKFLKLNSRINKKDVNEILTILGEKFTQATIEIYTGDGKHYVLER